MIDKVSLRLTLAEIIYMVNKTHRLHQHCTLIDRHKQEAGG